MGFKQPWSFKKYWDFCFEEKDTPWDLGAPAPSLISLEKKLLLPNKSTVIVPGCGYGHDALYWARLKYQVSAVDWCQSAIEELRIKGRREELELEALCDSVWNIPQSWDHTFDLYLEYTFFCAIDPEDRIIYLQNVCRLLKQGGLLAGVFFVDEQYASKSLKDNHGPPFGSSESQIRELFAKDFDCVFLEPCPDAHPKRRSIEWWACFKKK